MCVSLPLIEGKCHTYDEHQRTSKKSNYEEDNPR